MFAEIMEGPIENKAHFHQRLHSKELCYDFLEKKMSRETPCRWARACAGCDDDCPCFAEKCKHN